MFESLFATPPTVVEPVTEFLHGVPITDPYRWLEAQDSSQTRQWIELQSQYTRSYLQALPERNLIRARVRELLTVDTYDSLQKAGSRYFFRRRAGDEEQPSIYMRDGADGSDRLLLDPKSLRRGEFVSVQPLYLSRSGRILLYEIKEGGQRTGTFALLDVEKKTTLPDLLPQGLLRGFAFAPDERSFYYIHEPLKGRVPIKNSVFVHKIGTEFTEDVEVFSADEGNSVRLSLISDEVRLGFLVHILDQPKSFRFYLKAFGTNSPPTLIADESGYLFSPVFVPGRVLAVTDRDAPNRRIVEIRSDSEHTTDWQEIIPEQEARIERCFVVGDRIVICYRQESDCRTSVFDLQGRQSGDVEIDHSETTRFVGGSKESDELFIERESFFEPISIYRHSLKTSERSLWAKRNVPFDARDYSHSRTWYTSKDGTRVPIFLVGRRDVLAGGVHPTILNAYGGHGISMTPQFSVFVSFLLEMGCLFALPSIRGGSEFGREWHAAARGRKRQNAFDDFLSAAEWLIATGRTSSEKLAIFGGSNAGLLVGTALTQRPELFRAALCMVPLLDMLRYHLFDYAYTWREEYGTADDPDDFAALYRYSPYHCVKPNTHYPAVMILSGDADGKCNPLHARKMTARLQAANTSAHPILLDYKKFRGHSPVLPLSERIDGLTNRLAFLYHELGLAEQLGAL